MNKIIYYIFCLTLFFTSSVYSQSFDKLSAAQSALSASVIRIENAHEADKSFLEDVLRRKNIALREKIGPLINTAADDQQLNKLVLSQIELLEKLILLGDEKLLDLMKKSRAASEEEKSVINLLGQKRISSMDIYYQQLGQTLLWAESRGLNVAEEEKLFTKELVKRADFLTNAILYISSQQEYAERRLGFVSIDDAGTINAELSRFRERISMLVFSLQTSVDLMDSLSLDSTEYKQVLLATTGDINADVLDLEVALGLFDEWLDNFKIWAYENSPSMLVKLIVFIFVLYVARVISKALRKVVKKSVSHSKMNFSVLMQDFFSSIVSKVIMFIGLLVALSQVGIELAPLLTGFGVAGVIIGFALQDTLSNFASGLMILIYRPYDVGDMVKVAGIQGNVKNMSLVSTTIQTIDNQRLIIPNNKIWGDVINNITVEHLRRVDMIFGIGYADDIDKAKRVLAEILSDHEKILNKPESVVKLHTLNTSSVDFVVRPWVKTDDYWDVYWDVTENVKKRFDQENISIPFPQRDVHLYQHDSEE